MTHAPALAETGKVITRNVLFLAGGNAVTALISFGVTALLARHLGAEDYGILYLSMAFVQTAFILVDWGQGYYVVQAVARDRSLTGELFSTGIALRVVATAVVFLPVWGVVRLLGYPGRTRDAILIMVVFYLVNSIGGGFSVVFRGLERMDCEAVSQIALKISIAVATVAAVVLGAGLNGIILAQILGAGLAMVVFVRILRGLPVTLSGIRVRAGRTLLLGGLPFLLWTAVATLHTTVDAIMLSKLAPEEVVGWYGAAIKFTGVLIFPTTIVGSALYPTLSRLYGSEPERYQKVTRTAIKYMVYVGALTAGGVYLFASDAIAIVYGEAAFRPAADVLQTLSLFLFLLFIDVTLGTAIMAANRQRVLAYSKAISIVVLIAINALLVPLAQTHLGNGAIGCAAAVAVAELVMLVAALVLIPEGTIQAGLLLDLAKASIASIGMAVVVYGLGDMHLALRLCVAVVAFAGLVVLTRGIGSRDLSLLKNALRTRSTGSGIG
ncbi:MAG: flippase [Bradymonadales bacterium]|nr:flippase [Bradymonadales bacterium]